MTDLNVYIRTDPKKNISGFNLENNFTLKFTLPKNSNIKDLLQTFNQYRRPRNHIFTLHKINKSTKEFYQLLESNLLESDNIYFIL